MEDISKLLEENNQKTSQQEQDQVNQTNQFIHYLKTQKFWMKCLFAGKAVKFHNKSNYFHSDD